MSEQHTDRLDYLIDSYLSESLTAAEVDELRGMLESDPAAFTALMAAVDLHVALINRYAEQVQVRPASFRFWTYAILPVAAALAVMAGVWWFGTGGDAGNGARNRMPVISKSTGGEVVRADGVHVAAKAGRTLAAGDSLRTGAGQTATLAFPDETTVINLAQDSVLNSAVDPAFGKLLVLSAGNLTANVAKQLDGRPFAVRTPHAEIVVIGTQFALHVDSRGSNLQSLEGVVRVRNVAGGAILRAAAGSTVSIPAAGVTGVDGDVVKTAEMFPVPAEIPPSRSVAFDGHTVWVLADRAKIYGVSPDQGHKVTALIDLSAKVSFINCITAGDGALWGLAESGETSNHIVRVSIPSGELKVMPAVPAEHAGYVLVYGGGNLWCGKGYQEGGLAVTRIDPSNSQILGRFILKEHRYEDLCPMMWFDDNLWVWSFDGVLTKLDCLSGRPLVDVKWAALHRGILSFGGGSSGQFWTLHQSAWRVLNRMDATFIDRAQQAGRTGQAN